MPADHILISHKSLGIPCSQTIRPPDAYIPVRNDSVSFSADSAPIYDPDFEVIPSDNPTGRDNNQVSTIPCVRMNV